MTQFNYRVDKNKPGIQLTVDEYALIHGLENLTPAARFIFLQPIADAYKDVADTVKPYRGWYQSNRDFLRPLFGIRDLILSAIGFIIAGIMITLSPIALIIAGVAWVVINVFSDEKNKKEYNEELESYTKGYFRNMLGVTVKTGERAIRGITQIATTPLDWFIKMPLRGLMTWIKGVPKLEERDSVKRLVKEGNELLDSLNVADDAIVEKQDNFHLYTIVKALHIKLRDGVGEKKQQTNINVYNAKSTSFDILYGDNGSTVTKANLRQCLMLFAPKNNSGAGGNIPEDNLRNDTSYKS